MMMNLWEFFLLSVALAMDCFAVSIVSGVMMGVKTLRRSDFRRVELRLSMLFGFFQAGMLFLGWLCTNRFAHYVEDYDHWVAFGLLALVGGKMIYDSIEPEEIPRFNPSNWVLSIMLAVATSIDSLAVGISFSVMGYKALQMLLLPLLIVGLGSFLFCIAGHQLGLRYGDKIRRRLRPELVGGIILLLIGVKILITHLA